jgi:pSer/pThr/pTyr-binding forkhead associated (FHA) protein
MSSISEERTHYLVIVDGVAPGQSIELGDEALTIGRKPPSDLVLPDPRVSRRHCEVHAWRDEVRVTDLNSTNGTFVDGARVSGTISLRPGGALQVGEHVLEHKFWSKRELREWQALIEREETVQSGASIQIEVDAEKRRHEARQITENPFFTKLAAEIERLRRLQDEHTGA